MKAAAKMAKGKKKSFETYTITGESTPIFPLPARVDAIRVHKKLFDKGGCNVAKAPEDVTALIPSIKTDYPKMKIMHLDPLVLTVDDFFTPAECEAYLAMAENPSSHQIGSATFSSMTATSRTSTTWFLRYQDVAWFLDKARALTGRPFCEFEEPQLVRYLPGEAFGWHYDAVPPTRLNNGGQRRATLLVYLTDGGGSTAFRDLQIGGLDDNGRPRRLEVVPKRGRALLFFPSLLDGSPDERTLHAGNPAKQDKWIAQLWIHERSYSPTAPEGSCQRAAEELVGGAEEVEEEGGA